ncbi:hypothetical protein [Desulfofustis limnaeus]|uniref:Uncharacterized protein n=1 Tax=Desulfofustis limnaeus TaxID=2740163 RepID=A0ABM7W434_9BACT|nr:hypothetical protein [Desulfofustis limnaeus]MDX9894703.1 hypothetical protein [Desulfofustis sp.]BDD85681.1 hypothetical protein DPPLL_00460 [Desulfofustis limnaeus]
MKRGAPRWRGRFRALLSISVLAVSIAIYYRGWQNSPLAEPKLAAERTYLRGYLEKHAPDLARERLLAESYWHRYEDIRLHSYWGENGPMGIWGPRDHYEQHGRREGRLFTPLPEPQDLGEERRLAELYWQRYPAVRKSDIWGEDSPLGILGPRDHYQHIGRFHGNRWGDNADRQ